MRQHGALWRGQPGANKNRKRGGSHPALAEDSLAASPMGSIQRKRSGGGIRVSGQHTQRRSSALSGSRRLFLTGADMDAVEPFGDVATALSLLSAEAIHEVTYTLNFLQFFLQQEPGSEAAAETARFANTEFDRMHRLIGALRRFKLPVPEPMEVSVSTLVGQCIDQVQDAAVRRALSIEFRIAPETMIRTDAACLGSALRNLLLDALERVPAGTPIMITAICSDQQPLLLELSDGGAALPDHAATPLNGWDMGPLMSAVYRRTIAHWLLRHVGWSMSYEHTAQGNVFRLTAPLPMRLPL